MASSYEGLFENITNKETNNIKMIISPKILKLNDKKIIVTIKNNSKYIIKSSFYQQVSFLNNGKWENLEFKDGYIFFDDGKIVSPNSSFDFIETLDVYDFNFEPGKYKITKVISIVDSSFFSKGSKSNNIKNITLENEFLIKK